MDRSIRVLSPHLGTTFSYTRCKSGRIPADSCIRIPPFPTTPTQFLPSLAFRLSPHPHTVPPTPRLVKIYWIFRPSGFSTLSSSFSPRWIVARLFFLVPSLRAHFLFFVIVVRCTCRFTHIQHLFLSLGPSILRRARVGRKVLDTRRQRSMTSPWCTLLPLFASVQL